MPTAAIGPIPKSGLNRIPARCRRAEVLFVEFGLLKNVCPVPIVHC